MAEKQPWTISGKGRTVLEFLRGQDAPLTGVEVAEQTGFNPQGIHGILNPLVKNGLVSKTDKIRMEVVNKAGLREEKEYIGYAVTEAGLEFNL